MNCPKCKNKMVEEKGETPEGISYNYYKCNNCCEEIVDLKQLHSVAQQYREMKKYAVKVSKWGESLGIRIPKELVNQYGFRQNEELTLIPEKKAIKIVA